MITLMHVKRSILVSATTLIGALAPLSGCSTDTLPVQPHDATVQGLSSSHQRVTAMEGHVITSRGEDFAAAVSLRRAQRAGAKDATAGSVDLLVGLKTADAAPMDSETLRTLPIGQNGIFALPEQAHAERRFAFEHVPTAVVEQVRELLSEADVNVVSYSPFPLLEVSVPLARLEPAVRRLLSSPSVSFVELVQTGPAVPAAGPLGSNPMDMKHDMHNIDEAWSLTRGVGAELGIMDSGFLFNHATGAYHPDGQYFFQIPSQYGKGVYPRGFARGNYYYPCSDSQRAGGGCTPWDDHYHGTAMVGLAAAWDNNLGYVGIMPEGLTTSLKVTHTNRVNGDCSGDYCISQSDVIAATAYVVNHSNIKVVAMIFNSNTLGLSAYTTTLSAVTNYDVLMIAPTGNLLPTNTPSTPQSWSHVMGVGGVDNWGGVVGRTAYRDVSGYAGGATTWAMCSNMLFCTLPTDPLLHYYVYPQPGGGGTSAATANVAAIAALVRAYRPSLTAGQVWQKLTSTAVGPNAIVDAYAAMTAP